MEEIATVYARSLFEVAKESDKLDEVREQLGSLADAIADQHELQVFFFSPYFSPDEKKDGLRKAVSDADPIVLNFIDLLIEKHRMPAIMRIRQNYNGMWEQENDVLPVTVTSAVELDEETVRHIGDRIGEQTGRKVELSSKVEPDLLGGIVVRVGNSIIDASIRSRLEQLRKQVA
ncbi:MAG: ATP synthase F1 subunit delta [Solirubrobacterales bacterium]|nr:ATP synthase F1 subunit delta [Solirubrobacterales bacterium]